MKRITIIVLVTWLLALVACSLATGNPETPKNATPDGSFFGAVEPVQWGGDLSDASTLQAQYINVARDAGQTGALEWDGSSWYLGTAGGGVSPGAEGQYLLTNDAGTTAWVYPFGDVDASVTHPGDLTVIGLQGNPVSPASPTVGNTLGWDGGSWGPAALNLAGGSGYVTGALPTANQVSQSMGGDIVGSTNAAYVKTLSGNSSATTSVILTGTYLGLSGSSATYPNTGQIRVDDGVNIIAANSGGNPYVLMGQSAATMSLGASTGAADPVVDSEIYAQYHIGLNINGTADLYLDRSSANAYLGPYNGTSTPLILNWSTTTTPTLESGALATSFGIGTNKSGAVLDLNADANTNILQLSSTGADLVTGYLGLNGAAAYPTSGQIRVADGTDIMAAVTSGVTQGLLGYSAGTLVVGSNNAGNHYVSNLQFWSNSTMGLVVAGATATQFGATQIRAYGAATYPLTLDWSTSTTPTILSGTSATNLTSGTNKTAATYVLSSDANAATLTLDWANLLATFASGVNVKLTAAYEDISQMTAPAAPSSGSQRMYVDSADSKLKVIDSAGNITVLSP